MNHMKQKNILFKYLLPILLFTVISIVYFYPVLEGKVLQQSDTIHHIGNTKYNKDFRAETGEEALWNVAMFSGMPTYLNGFQTDTNWIGKAKNIFYKIPRPASYLILSFLFFYVFLLLFGVNPWISFAGALLYGFTSFFFVIIESGHNTKAHALSYMALIIGGILFAYKKNRIGGGIITAVGLSWMILANHLQMTYYTAIMVLIIAVVYFIDAFKKKTLPSFLKTSAILLVAAILAVGTNLSKFWPTYEYSKYTIRGESELTPEAGEKSSGLDKDYILDYSYDLGEAFTAFIPRLKGGSMAEPLGEDSNVYKLLQRSQGKQNALRIANNLPLYWGSQPIAGGPFYFGAVLCFLFVFGLFVVKGKDKWWIIATVLVSFALSLGKYFPALSNLMIDYFPLYNKFRDVKNIIVIQQFAMAALGVWAVREIYLKNVEDNIIKKGLLYSFSITGGIALLLALIPGIAGDFSAATDARLVQSGWPEQLISALQDDRRMVLQKDAFRTFIFVALTAGMVWAFWKEKLKAKYALALWIVLILADTWPVNKRYLNNDNFVAPRKMESPYTKSQADNLILQDTSVYRVLNLTVNPFTDASTSFFHKSIGGYHAAKMGRYQELIENRISPEIQLLSRGINSGQLSSQLWNNTPVLDMLNAKYIIVNANAAPLQNPKALGNAWFVSEYKLVENADEEIAALKGFNPAQTAIVDQRFESFIQDKNFTLNDENSITLADYGPNYIKYTASARSEQLTVFSEVYYDKGWNAYIDGEKIPHFRVNYVLRALILPAGDHTVEFKFEPRSVYLGNKLSLVSSILLILAVLGYAFFEIKRIEQIKNTEDSEN